MCCCGLQIERRDIPYDEEEGFEELAEDMSQGDREHNVNDLIVVGQLWYELFAGVRFHWITLQFYFSGFSQMVTKICNAPWFSSEILALYRLVLTYLLTSTLKWFSVKDANCCSFLFFGKLNLKHMSIDRQKRFAGDFFLNFYLRLCI